MTYSEIKIALTEIATRIDQNRKRIAQAKGTLSAAASDLNGMTAQYTPVVQAIAALESDAANDVAKAESSKLVAEFQALKAEADDLVTAVTGG